jgi:hypothetical protein
VAESTFIPQTGSIFGGSTVIDSVIANAQGPPSRVIYLSFYFVILFCHSEPAFLPVRNLLLAPRMRGQELSTPSDSTLLFKLFKLFQLNTTIPANAYAL